MWPVSRTIDRYDTTFDHDGLISNAGLVVTATLMVRLGLEQLSSRWVRTGAPNAGRKICTLVAAMLAAPGELRGVLEQSGLACTGRPFGTFMASPAINVASSSPRPPRQR